MVKGITRQVILVKSPDPKLFEEAIFIVKEEALAREGVSADQVIRGGQTGGGRLSPPQPGMERPGQAASRTGLGSCGGGPGLAGLGAGSVSAVTDLRRMHTMGCGPGGGGTRLPGLPVQG